MSNDLKPLCAEQIIATFVTVSGKYDIAFKAAASIHVVG